MNLLHFRHLIGRDFRYAVRALTRSPAFTSTAIFTLALVIGANTAVFSLTDAILIKPLPYPESENLARLEVAGRTIRGEGTIETHDGATWEHLRDGVTAIDVAVTRGGSGLGREVNLSVDSLVSSVGQERVSAGYFRVLGIPPLLGREFTLEEDRPGGPAVAVLSYDLWQRAFDGDPSAVGETLLLRGEPYEVVGIMPASFRSLTEGVDVWTPVRPSLSGEGLGTNYGIIARVKPGFTWTEALARMPPLDEDYFRRFMGSDWAASEPTGGFSLAPLQQAITANAKVPLITIFTAAAIVMLIACVNLAALLAARAGGRAKEIATRMALGSGRGAVVRQLFTESLVLGAVGGALGLLVARFGLDGLKAIGTSTYGEWSAATLDWRALALTAGLAFVTSVLFGLYPALHASRVDVRAALSDGGGKNIAGRRRRWAGRLLVGAQTALGVVLLIVAGLLIRTFVNLQSLDPGFDSAGVVTASVSLQDARYDSAAQMNGLFEESLRRIEATPGVESAAVSLGLPYQHLLNLNFAFTDEETSTGPRIANVMYTTPDLFETLRIPHLGGRLLAESDGTSSPPVVVVSQDFVDIVANGDSPIGRRIRIGNAEREIVGIVGSVKVAGAGFYIPGMMTGPLTSAPLIYMPASQTPDSFMAFHNSFSPMWTVRARDLAAAEAMLQQAISAADPLLPIRGPRRMSDIRAEATAEERLLTVLVGVLATAALLLAATGLYGLVAQAIGERRREFGVRMALGATAVQTMRSIALSGVTVAGIGAAFGLLLAWMTVRVLDSRSILWGVESRDPATFIAVSIFLILVASIASFVPARRIMSLEPAKALRD
jgi:predicted permease